MSKWILAVGVLLVCLSAVAHAADVYSVYNFGSGTMNDSFGGGAAPGMRFGDIPQVGGNAESGFAACESCFGVQPHPCDPCWRGPCMDWKLIGWYSHWSGHGCHRRCCATPNNASNNSSCVTCQ